MCSPPNSEFIDLRFVHLLAMGRRRRVVVWNGMAEYTYTYWIVSSCEEQESKEGYVTL